MLKRAIWLLKSYEGGSLMHKSDTRELLHSLPIDWSNPLYDNILDSLESPAIRTLVYRALANQLKTYGSITLPLVPFSCL